jgi:hypothetical protein
VGNLTAVERPERDGAIYTRYWTGSAYTHRTRLCDGVRDTGGNVVPALENEAREAAQARERLAASGVADVSAARMTLEALFRRLLHAKDGKYATPTPWTRDVQRSGRVVVKALAAGTLAADIRHAHYRKLWRYLAAENVRSKGAKYGPRAAELIVGALRSAIAWAHTEELLEAGVGLPAREWKRQMREEWVKITKQPIRPPAKPRYDREEQARLWAALPAADPRLRLAVELGAELRLGQITRSRRSDVLPFGGHDIGAVVVHGSGKKLGTTVVLSDAERAVVTAALTDGYLADLEAEYRAKRIPDYFLIPARKLLKGRAHVESADVAWERTGMRKAWWRLEEAAGVEHQHGRKWYGLRRLHADLAEDTETDERVLDQLGGWSDSATRRMYQQQGRTDVLEKATEVRGRIRPRGTS